MQNFEIILITISLRFGFVDRKMGYFGVLFYMLLYVIFILVLVLIRVGVDKKNKKIM